VSKSLVTLSAFLVVLGFSATALAAPPTASTSPATSITPTSAVLNGVGTPGGEASTGWFRYSATNPGVCNDSFGARVPASGGTDLGTGTVAIPYGITTTGLTSGVTYYFCAIVQNPSGTAFGTLLTFTVPGAPITVSNPPTLLTATTATLEGDANPVAAATTGWFRYASVNPGTCNDTFGTRAPASSGSVLGMGTTSVSYNRAITGLTPGAVYFFCAVAQNLYGTTFGSVLTFTTPGTTPTVSTGAPTSITGAGATLNGSANPGGDPSTGYFRYATISPGTCNDSFGTRTPSSGGSSLGQGNSSVVFSQAVGGLTPGVTYYACAIASNAYGTGLGGVVTFVTPSEPVVTTVSATAIGNTTATLNGSGIPNRAATTGYFRYATVDPGACNDTFGSRAPVGTGGSGLGSGTTAMAFSQGISGLSNTTTYYYCAIAVNTEGIDFGNVLSFTTVAAPTTTTVAATLVTATTATLNGFVNANGAVATAWHRYNTVNPGTCNDSFGTRAPGTGSATISGTTDVALPRAITGLLPSTTYYFCAIANNAYGTTFGAVLSFTTAAASPTVSTNAPSFLTGMTAQLNGTGNPGGAATSGWFRYDTVSPGTCNDTFGTRAPASGGSALGSGNASVAFNQSVSGLNPGTTYYVCAIDQNSVGLAVGSVVTFVTPAGPTVITNAASAIASTTVTLNGAGDPNGTATTGYFRYATTNPGTCNDTFGSRAPTSGGSALGTGTSSVAYSQGVSALSAGATYYFCAIANNSEGTAFGAVLSFTTLAAPTVLTEGSSLVTTSSATLEGSANPNGAAATGWFRYATANPGSCNDTFGLRAPTPSGGTALGSGTAAVAYVRAITGLIPNTTYYFCAIASNTYGTSFGAVRSFTTPPAGPVVVTSAATMLTGTTGQLNGSSNPGGDATTAWFRYSTVSPGTCNDSFGTRTPSSGGTALGSGTTSVVFNQPITGLSPGITYYYCALASNVVGTSFGSVVTFVTPSAPTAVTNAATAIAATTVTLNGSGIPNLSTTTGYFRYATTHPGTCNDTFGSRAPTSGGTNLSNGTTSIAYAQPVSGLSAGSTYYFCAVTSNAEGIAFGAVLSFTTLAAPSVTTLAASALTSSSATLNGSANPNGAAATGYYRYALTNPGACNDTFGTRAPSTLGTTLGAGTSAVAFPRSISGLTPNSTYYVCAIANNTYGVGFGSVLSFNTLPAAPTAVTNSVSALTGTTAQLNGTSNPGGAATTGWFRYSTVSPGTCNDSFGTRAPSAGGTALGSGTTSLAFNQPITGLTPGTTYYACAIADNAVDTALGGITTFVTPSAPTAVTTAATAITATSATFNGIGNPNRAATTGYFRYGTTNPGTCSDTFGSRAPTSGGTNLGNGSSDVAFAVPVSGLSAGSTYYLCAVTTNSEGIAFGAVLSFITLAQPAVTTAAATAITASTATLNGQANPRGAPSTGYYRYATANPGTCNDSFGVRAPLASGGTALGAVTTDVPFPRGIGALTPNTTYYFCAIASNAYGTGFGAVLSFTTLPAAPTVATNTPTALTGSTAQLNATSNPGGASTTGWFRYSTVSPGSCNDSFGTRAPTVGGSSVGAGTTSVAFNQPIAGLSPGTTYYACAIADNAVGTALGGVVTFVTPAAPTVVTLAASGLSSSSASLNGSGNPNRAPTTGYFRYAATNPVTCNDTFGSRAPVSGGSSLGNGISPVAFAQSIGTLSAGTTYYYCAITSNSEGMAFGAVLTFTTLAAPAVTTLAATTVTSSAAVLNGAATPNGATALGWFRYASTNPGSCTDGFGTRTPASSGTGLGAGTSDVSYLASIAGLLPGTTYYFCAIASNSAGTGFGSLVSFTTAPALPSVATNVPTMVTTSGATFNGSANPNGDGTTAWFRIDTVSPGTCNDSFGTRLPSSSGTALGGGTIAVAYTQTATLSPGTLYYVCAIAQNGVGTAFGTVRSFTTPALPDLATFAATPITATTATLNGSVDPNGNTTTSWFRYATTSPGTCSDAFGFRAPASGGFAAGAGTAPVNYGQAISGLTPATTYYFCAIGSSAIGTAFGSILSFTTPSTTPVVTTLAASSVGLDGAVLNADGNPNGLATTGWFRYSSTNPVTCNDTFGTRTPTSGGTALGSGTTTTSFSATVSGLPTGVTYYFCAIAQNSLGTSVGTVRTFTTTAAPSVATLVASAVTGTTATLEGSANPNAVSSTGYFRYASTSPGACSDAFGTRAPTSGGTALGAGSAVVPYNRPITGLLAGTTYYYCAIASSASGVGFGTVQSFTTPGAPTVTTDLVAAVTSTSATFGGTANPNLSSTTGWVRYASTNPGSCNDTFGTRMPSSGGSALGAGASPVAYTQPVTTLVASTTYYYCAIASNGVGTRFGALLSFSTPAAPTVTTVAASSVGSTAATLNGTGDPNLSSATGWFRYASTTPGTCNDTFGTRAPSSGGAALGAGTTPVPFAEPLTGLTSGTTYYFCAIAMNAAGTSFGNILSFTTPGAPSVTSLAATAVGSTTATLQGTGTANLSAATGWFRYASSNPGTCNDSFGTRAPLASGMSLGSGTTATAFNQPVTGLTTGTTYYFCAIAQNAVGTSLGALLSFTTASAPTVTTVAASSLGSTSVTLNGQANPNLSSSTGFFRYASTDPGTCSDSFGVRAPVSGGTALGAGAASVAYTQNLTGLVAGTTYYFCAIASNAIGTGVGSVMSFTTPAAPSVTTVAATAISSTAATINGSASPQLSSTTGWLRYATTNPGACNDSFGVRAPLTGSSTLGAGSTAVAYSESLTGLVSGATYFFCAIAQNAIGTSFGAVLSFTTPSAAGVNTLPATLVSSTGATLNATANPNFSATTGYFRYGATDPGACTDTFGTRAPAAGGSALGAGGSAVPYAEILAGLTPASTYYYCAVASSGVGTAFGAVLTFTTPAAPTVVTTGSTPSPTSAVLTGNANPNFADTNGYFRYATSSPGACNDTFGLRAPVAGGSPLGAGGSTVTFAQTVTGLTPRTTYFYCALAANSVATGFGAVMSFTTPELPTVTTEVATSVSDTSATLNGSAIPNFAETTGWIRYGSTNPGTCNDTFGTRAPVSGGASLGAGSTAVTFSQSVTGLVAGATYYFCALAENSVGTTVGTVLTFTTPSAAVVNTLPATLVSSTGATLNGSANPNLSPTTGYFRYGATDPGTSCSDTFGTRTPISGGTALGAGSTSVPYLATLTGLTPATRYFYCAAATSSIRTEFGAVLSFATPAAPIVVTGTAMPSSTTAVLDGSATPNFADTTGYFRYDIADPGVCNDAFGTRAPSVDGAALGAGGSPASYMQTIGGLSPLSTYYFCAIATNSVGTSFGTVVSFTTTSAPSVVTEAASDVMGSDLSLNGQANPNGGDATGWFRYDTVDPAGCDDAFGTRAPLTGGTPLGGGSSPVTFTEMLMGLSPATTYYFCAIAENPSGVAFGEVLTVTTEAAAPSVITEAPTVVTDDGATLNGSAIANGSAASGWFRYATTNPGACDDSFGTRAPTSGGTDLGAGTTSMPFTQMVSGLTIDTVYYYCAIAENAEGLGFGELQMFAPGAPPPLVTTEVATEIAGTTASLNGTATANGTDATGWFRIGTLEPSTCDDTFGMRAPATGGMALGAGFTATPFTEATTELEPNQTYFYCAAASNLGGAIFGEVQTFTTEALPPTVRTVMPTIDPMTGEVTLNGAASPNGLEAIGWFRYDSLRPTTCDDSYGFRVPLTGDLPLGAGRTEVDFASIADLVPGTYYVCAGASNSAGAAFGELMTFVVPESSVPEGGCGCRAGMRTQSPAAIVALLGLVMVLVQRRRRR